MTRRDRWWISRLGIVLAGVTLAPASFAQAVASGAWSPRTVVQLARTHRAEILAARARADAARVRPRIVSAPNDPMLMASLDHLPFRFDGANFSVMAQQDFPLSNLLGARGREAEWGARRLENDVRRVTLDVEAEALRAFFMLAERRATGTVLNEVVRLSDEVVTLATARYAAGQGAQAEVLRAQLDAVRWRNELGALEGQIRAAEAMLDAAVGREATAPVPELRDVSANGSVPSEPAVTQRALAARPEIATMRLSASQARAEVQVMEAMFWPMMFVRTGFSYAMAEGPGAMLMVGVSIPVFRGRLNAGVDEARAMVRMADADVEAMRNMVRGEAVAARAQLLSQRARRDGIRRDVLPTARQAVTSSLAAYAGGQVPLVAVVDALRMLSTVRMDEVMADVNVGLAEVRLQRAIGEIAPAGVP